MPGMQLQTSLKPISTMRIPRKKTTTRKIENKEERRRMRMGMKIYLYCQSSLQHI
jgi:hypothetical protein